MRRWRIDVTIGVLMCAVPACTPAGSDEKTMGQTANRIELNHYQKSKRVDVTIDGKPFTSYLYIDRPRKPVLYPIRSARGTLVSRGYPAVPRKGERTDHPHQMGLWLNYGHVNGLDFWNNSEAIPVDKRGGYGVIRHTGVTKMAGGDKTAELAVTAEWTGQGGKAILREATTFVFSGDTHRRCIDRTTTLTAAAGDVSLADNKEGLLGLRVARQLEQPGVKPAEKAAAAADGVNGRYHSSRGLDGDAVWGTRAEWVKLAGKIGDETVSVVIFDHPSNPGAPTYWHARGYGLFAANPLGQKQMSGGKETLGFKLSAGESATFRYRVLIDSRDELPDTALHEEYRQFAGTRDGL